jgi:hypothetical protein
VGDVREPTSRCAIFFAHAAGVFFGRVSTPDAAVTPRFKNGTRESVALVGMPAYIGVGF